MCQFECLQDLRQASSGCAFHAADTQRIGHVGRLQRAARLLAKRDQTAGIGTEQPAFTRQRHLLAFTTEEFDPKLLFQCTNAVRDV
ncbi:hypothetical protein D9M69_714130 [compost metagenome]